MRGFHKINKSLDRWGNYIAPVLMLLAIVGFHGQPVLWIPLVLLFAIIWIHGLRSDRKDEQRRRFRRG